MSFGRPRRHFRTTDSTNERARALAESGAPGGTIVTAAEQTAGRGRQGRAWTAPAGKALLASVIVRPLGADHGLLPLAAPLAVCEAVESLTPLRCEIKWPNDIWVDGRKVAGLLIEARPGEDWAVVGAGLNLSIEPGEFPEELRDSAASIGHGVGPDDALAALCAGLDKWVGAHEVLAAYRERDALRGREISWGEESGTADGIADDGNLLVVRGDGERLALGAGEVHLSLR